VPEGSITTTSQVFELGVFCPVISASLTGVSQFCGSSFGDVAVHESRLVNAVIPTKVVDRTGSFGEPIRKTVQAQTPPTGPMFTNREKILSE